MTNSDWYARKFGNPPQQPQQPVYPPQYYQQPVYPPQYQPVYPPQAPSPYPPAQFQQPQVVMPQQPVYPYPPQMYPTVPQAMPGMKIQEAQGFVSKPPASTRRSERCPECDSGNYMKRGQIGTQNGTVEAWVCFDCGYPTKQSGSGAGGFSAPGQSGKAMPAKQIPTGGFNPQGIVGRIDSL